MNITLNYFHWGKMLTMKMISSSTIKSIKPAINWAMLTKYKGH